MLIQKESSPQKVSIKGYRPGAITIAGIEYSSPMRVTAGSVEKFQVTDNFSSLTSAQLLALLEEDTELLLIGSGERHLFLPHSESRELLLKGVGIEVMSTRNACHTFQVLIHENRRVIALLFP